ncbi:hypothetical protein QW131_16870 [Roseibium salinum]|nr:hypothetical protein [Roseibium salinum]
MTPESAAVALEKNCARSNPVPIPPPRAELSAGLAEAAASAPPGAIVWLSDNTGTADSFTADLDRIAGDAPVTVMTGLETPMGLKDLANDAEALSLTVVRHPARNASTATVQALDLKGLVLGEVQSRFAAGETETAVRFELPTELRNDIARVEISGEAAAGAVQLVDDSWRRRTVGLISGQSGDLDQPLLSPIYYLERALAPFSDIRQPREADIARAVPSLIDQGISVLVLADVGRLPDTTVETLREWVQKRRHARPVCRPQDRRRQRRTDTGDPQGRRPVLRRLADMEATPAIGRLSEKNSPFSGLKTHDEVTVTRQVLAEPTADLPDRTWAMLEDGTPLVTADTLGAGNMVLFPCHGGLHLVQPAALRRFS